MQGDPDAKCAASYTDASSCTMHAYTCLADLQHQYKPTLASIPIGNYTITCASLAGTTALQLIIG